jgi:hypothetical protein
MSIERLAKTTVGAAGGATGGLFMGFLGGAMGGVQLGIPIGFIAGILYAFSGAGFAGFLGCLISTCFLLGLFFGVVNAVIYGIGGAVIGSSWGNNKSSNS